MATPDNILKQVATYQNSGLAYLQNQNCFISTLNTKFKNFQNLTANLGSTVDISLPTLFTTTDGLVASFKSVTQRSAPLTIDNSKNTSYSFTNLEDVLNLGEDAWMKDFGMGAMDELGAVVEKNVASEALKTYRFYGNGSTDINTYDQIANAIAIYRNQGSAPGKLKCYLSGIVASKIVGNGHSKFTPDRNNQTANSWEIGSFDRTDFYRSNLLPIHIAGDAGQTSKTLTFVSINPAGDEITFSGAGTSISNSLNENDLLEFETDVFALTYRGHHPSESHVQVRITENADSNGSGNVVAKVYPPLVSTAGEANQNISRALTTSDTAKVMNSHRAGLITSGNAFYLAMPKLPEEVPFPTFNDIDPDTGVSMRMYYGSKFGENQRGFVHDVAWAKTLVPEYGFRLLLPL